MADLPELWTERTPERTLSDRTPTFGLAREAERLPQEVEPEPVSVAIRKARRERGPFLTYLCLPWSYSDNSTADRWHKMQCRFGRHHMDGGHTMHVDGTVIFVERHCRWCGTGGAAFS